MRSEVTASSRSEISRPPPSDGERRVGAQRPRSLGGATISVQTSGERHDTVQLTIQQNSDHLTKTPQTLKHETLTEKNFSSSLVSEGADDALKPTDPEHLQR